MAGGPAARRADRVGAVGRCAVQYSEAVDTRRDRIQPAVSGAAVFVGRDIHLWVRLLGIHADAVPAARGADSTRCGPAGGVGGDGEGRARPAGAGGSALFRLAAGPYYAHRDVYRQ